MTTPPNRPPAGRPYDTPQAAPGSRVGLEHGYDGDPRYPSSRRLRKVLAFIVDLALALAGLVGAFFLARRVPGLSSYPPVVAIVAMLLVSFVNRVLVQWAFRTSVGKAIFGLRLVRKADGGRPGFATLVTVWALSVVWTIGALADAATDADPSLTRFPAIVRARDIRGRNLHVTPTR